MPPSPGSPCSGGSPDRSWTRCGRSRACAGPAVEPEDFTACPVLLAHPGADRWTPVELSTPFFDRLGGDKRLVVLEGCGHMPVEEPGLRQFAEALGRLAAGSTRRRSPAAPEGIDG